MNEFKNLSKPLTTSQAFSGIEKTNRTTYVIYISMIQWRCPSCQSINGRDENAAKNIQAVGASTVGLGDVRRAMLAITV